MNNIVGAKYPLQERLGWGSFGEVFASGPYAVKMCKFVDSTNRSQSQSIINEIRFLARLRHPNIVQLHQIILEEDALCIVMQRCESDLDKLISRNIINNRYCTEEEALQIIRQIVKGYKELILRKIVHRDLKPANILISKDVIKIADFGIARMVDRQNQRLLSTHVGTICYMAPQVIQKVNYSRKCDIWSLGVILYELLFSRRPWYAKNEQELLYHILSRPLLFPRTVSPWIKTLLQNMLSISEDSRISWQELENRVMIKQRQFSHPLAKRVMQLEANWLSARTKKQKYTSLCLQQKRHIQNELTTVLKPSLVNLLDLLQ